MLFVFDCRRLHDLLDCFIWDSKSVSVHHIGRRPHNATSAFRDAAVLKMLTVKKNEIRFRFSWRLPKFFITLALTAAEAQSKAHSVFIWFCEKTFPETHLTKISPYSRHSLAHHVERGHHAMLWTASPINSRWIGYFVGTYDLGS